MNIGIYIFFLLNCLVLCGAGIQRKKQNRLWTATLAMIMVWMLLVANHEGDNQEYLMLYLNNSEIIFKDTGYALLISIGKKLHLDFFMFKKVIVAFALCLWVHAQKKYVDNIAYVFFLYMVSFVFMDSQVLRNFLSMCMLMLSINYLADTSKKVNAVCFVVCTIVAASIHKGFVFYLIFLVVLFRERTQFAKVLFSVGIITTAVTILNNNKIPFVNILVSIFAEDSRSVVLKTTTRFGALPVLALYLYMLLIVWYLEIRKTGLQETKKINYIQFVFMLDICMAPILPLVLTNLNFYRLVKNVAVINYGVLAISYQRRKKVVARVGVLALSMVLALGWLWFETKVFATYESVVQPVLDGYLFFE